MRRKMVLERIVAMDSPGQEKAGVIDDTSCRALRREGVRRRIRGQRRSHAPIGFGS
jgi:hypothetical protein